MDKSQFDKLDYSQGYLCKDLKTNRLHTRYVNADIWDGYTWWSKANKTTFVVVKKVFN